MQCYNYIIRKYGGNWETVAFRWNYTSSVVSKLAHYILLNRTYVKITYTHNDTYIYHGVDVDIYNVALYFSQL